MEIIVIVNNSCVGFMEVLLNLEIDRTLFEKVSEPELKFLNFLFNMLKYLYKLGSNPNRFVCSDSFAVIEKFGI